MNLTKKNKLIAGITTAVICLAIVVTACVICVPNLYNNGDLNTSNTANNPYATYDSGGYGMEQNVDFDMAVTYAVNGEDYVWIYYPRTIYMDTTESLESLGYNFIYYCHYGSDGNTDYHHALFRAPMGYYKDKNGNNNSRYNDATNNNANFDSFFNDYSISSNVLSGSNKNYNNNDGWTWESSQNNGDGAAYSIVYYEGGKFIANGSVVKTQMSMSGTGKAGSYTYKRLSNSPIFIARKYDSVFNPKVFKFALSSFTDVATASSSGRFPADLSTSTPITQDISIQIEIYDKSSLLSAMKDLENKYNALNNAGLLNQQARNDFSTFKTDVTTNYLKKREVTVSALASKLKAVQDYTFNLSIADPSLGTEQNPQSVNYTGSAYNLSNIWKNTNGVSYSSNIPNTNITYATAYPSGSMSYSATGTSWMPYTDKNNLINAGYYKVTFTPDSSTTRTINVTYNGTTYSAKVKFYWNNNDSNEKTGYFYIAPAQISISGMSSSVSMTYNGNTPNVLTGLPGSNPTINLVRSDLNPATVQLSLDYLDNDAAVWEGVGNRIEFPDVTDEDVTVYYRVSAENHVTSEENGAYGSFTVEVRPADIRVKLKHFEQVFYSDLLTSDEIFEKMLDENTPNILDATNHAATVDYLKLILSFGILNDQGGYFASTDKPNAASYTVDAIKTDDEDWSKRIGRIEFVDSSNTGCYQITPQPIEVQWSDNANKWYDDTDAHRPSAQIVDGQDTHGQTVGLSLVSVVGGEAVNAGDYTATVSSTNSNFAISNNTYPFTVEPRKISITIVDRTRTYAQALTAEELLTQYEDDVLANNTNNGAYIAVLDEEIANATGSNVALIHDGIRYKEVFKVTVEKLDAQDELLTPDGSYYVAGTHVLKVSLVSNNYEFTSAIDGKFIVDPARLEVTVQQMAPKVYIAESQDIILPLTFGEDGTVTALSGYELAHPDECITVEYSSTGRSGPWSTTPLQITNVIESPKTVYYKVSAPNHKDYVSEFKQELRAVNIEVFFDGQTEAVYYGDAIPTSDELLTLLQARFNIEERAEVVEFAPEDLRDIHPAAIFDFYLLDPVTHQAIISRNADAGKYTVSYRLKSTVSERDENFNVIFHLKDNGDRVNVDVYTISPKRLYINWSQAGERWSAADGSSINDRYTFSNSIPMVYPTAPNSTTEGENVVPGDDISLAGIELGGAYVNQDGYTVTTALTKDRNKNNYYIDEEDASHTFYIIPLHIEIAIKDQIAVYGQAQVVPIGTQLEDPLNTGALWDYAKGSENRFYADHYRNWMFVSQAHSSDGSLVDVKYDEQGNVAGYDIGILPSGIGDGTIRGNYDVNIVKEPDDNKNALFYINPANIHYNGRQFNIDYENENNVLDKQQLIDRISTGLEEKGVDISQFTVKMSEKFLQTDTSVTEENATWVESTAQITDDLGCARYYVLLVVEHNKGNFNKFTAKVELNILTDWVSVKVGGGVTDAEYGYEVHSSNQIFESLDFLSIAGFMTTDGEQLWNVDPDAAIEKLKEYVTMFVGAGDTVSAMAENGAVGDYSIFMELNNNTDGEYENFRFVARDGESDTSNINAYHVNPRTISVEWIDEDMNEVYGNHGSSHNGYRITNLYGNDDASTVRLTITHYIADVENNTAAMDEGGHAHTVGYYLAKVEDVSNPNYRLTTKSDELEYVYQITPKPLDIALLARTFDYGTESASVDGVDTALNVYSLEPNYTFEERTPFVGTDRRDDIFTIFLDGDKGSNKYLDAGTYTINAKQRTDTAVAINYAINIVATAMLTINKADAGLNVKQLTTMQFNAREQEIHIDTNWLVLVGDTELNRNQAKVWFKQIAREDLKEPEDAEMLPEGEFKLREAGRYELLVHIEAPNHNDFDGIVNLNILAANVIINMNQTEKVYGDTLAQLLAEAHLPSTATLSDWLKLKCGITITMYLDLGGGNRTEEDITAWALDDFIFYVVDSNQLDGDGGAELQPGAFQNNVGDYRVYHKIASGELASNYSVEYYQEIGAPSKCNAHAYKITPRAVDVDWSVSDAADWNGNKTEYYYTGNQPGLVAQFVGLADSTGNTPTITLLVTGIDNYNVNADGEKYTAHVSHDYWNSNTYYASNYTLTRDSYEFSIVKRPITVTVNNQNKGAYGTVLGGVELTQSNAIGGEGAYLVRDEIARTNVVLAGNPLLLVLEDTGVASDEFLPAGRYAIGVTCSNPNYDVTVKGLASGDECGWLIVDKANFSLSTTPITYGNYRGVEFTLDFKQFFIERQIINANAFVSGDDWQTAWTNAQITYKQDGITVDSPLYTGAGTTTVEYSLTFDNYVDFTGTFVLNVSKAVVNVSVTKVTSIYGDALLTSAEIFELSNVTLTDDTIDIAIDEIITLYVDSSAKNVANYDIKFAYLENQESNFNVNLVDNAGMYEIVPRTIVITWEMDEDDEALDTDGKYIFDGKPHKIIYDAYSNVIDGDVIEPRFEETSQKDKAGTYIARLISIGNNSNYALPEDCTFEWTIKPRPITVNWTVEEYTYDGTSKLPSATVDPTNMVLGTSCGVTVSGTQTNAGTYTAVATATSTDYIISNDTQEFTIKAREITVIWSEETTFEYDGQSHAPTATIDESQLIGADKDAVVNVTVSGSQVNAGKYTASVSALDNSNYIVVGATVSFEITKKQVFIVYWANTQTEYTQSTIVPEAMLNGVLEGDSVDVIVSGGQVDVGTYTATATGLSNGNYELLSTNLNSTSFTITQGINEFNGLYGNGDSKEEQTSIPWQGDDKPTDKFGGEVIIKYYSDAECTKEIAANKIKDGTYWAVAYVAGTDNYGELVSNPYEFKIDNGMNVALAVCGIVISLIMLGGVLTVILVINKKRKGGNV